MFKNDIFEPDLNFSIEEASGEVDGKHVLGRIKGCFFVPNGISRNNRYYPKELWEKVLNTAEVKKRLAERRMFGTISHTQAIDDTALLEGKISHIVTGLSIQNGQGVGEALILDTPAGKVLNTFLRAGSKLYVSSRANGAFKGEENGVPRVDPETYELAGFDVVIDPGFVQANPKLVEALDKLLQESSINLNKHNLIPEEEIQMKEVLESVSRENASLKNDLDKVMRDLATTKNENTVLADDNKHTRERFSKMEAQIAEMTEKLKKYETLGKPEEIDQALDVTDSKLKKYEALGNPEELAETLNKSKAILEDYSKIGTPKKIEEALDKSIAVMRSIAHLGSPAQIEEALDKGIKQLTEYKEFGTITDLKTLFEKLEKSAVTMQEAKAAKKITEMANSLNVSEEAIKELWGKLSEEQIKAFFAKINPPAPVVGPVAPVAPVQPKVEEATKKIAEKFVKKEVTAPVVGTASVVEQTPSFFAKTRGERMMEALSN